MISARLSLIQGEPFASDDVVSSTAWLVPHLGGGVAVRQSGAWQNYTVPDASLPLNLSSLPAGSMHDLFAAVFNGALVLARAAFPDLAGCTLTGTPIGGMANLSAAFGGVVNTGALSAHSPSAATGFAEVHRVGTDYGPGAQVILTGFRISGPSDDGFRGDQVAIPYRVDYLSDDGLSWGSFYPGTTPAGTGQHVEVLSGLPATPHRGYSFIGYGNSNNWVRIGECAFTVQDAGATDIPRGITRISGLPVNDAALHLVCDAGEFDCPANEASYLGSLAIGTAGQARIDFSYGTDRRVDLWNYYHPRSIRLQSGVTEAQAGATQYLPLVSSSGYSLSPIANRGDVCGSIISGLERSQANAAYQGAYFQNGSSAATAFWNAIGEDSVSSPSGKWSSQNFDNNGDLEGLSGTPATHTAKPFMGSKKLYALEGGRGALSGFYGQEDMQLAVDWEY